MGRNRFLKRIPKRIHLNLTGQSEQHCKLIVAVSCRESLTRQINTQLGLRKWRYHILILFICKYSYFSFDYFYYIFINFVEFVLFYHENQI